MPRNQASMLRIVGSWAKQGPMKGWLKAYVTLSVRRPWHLLALAAIVTALAAMGTRRLKLSTNFARLLPQDTASVRATKEAARRVGSTDLLVISVQSNDPVTNVHFLDELGKRLKENRQLGFILWKIDTSFFRKHGLLYLDKVDLEQLYQTLKERVGRETQKKMGLFVDLDEPDDSDNGATKDPCAAPKQDELSSLVRRFQNLGSPTDVAFYRAKNRSAKAVTGYLTSPDGSIAVLVAKPKKESLTIAYVRRMVRTVWHQASTLRTQNPKYKNLKVELGGAYRNRVNEYDRIVADVVRSGALSALLIAAVAILMFRRIRPAILIFLPLTCGVLWTMGLISLTSLRHLNIISAFIVGILLGLGIDFGVHLSARYLQERADGKDLTDALTRTLIHTGRAIAASAATTAAALFILTVSKFKGFSQFGVIAGSGVLISLAAFVLLFPPLAAAMERIWAPKRWKPFLAVRQTSRSFAFPKTAAIVLAVAVAATGLAAWKARDLQFEYNFRNLTAKKGTHANTIKYGKAMGNRASPTVALAPDAKSAHEFYELLKQRTNGPVSDPLIRDIMAIGMLVPSNQQAKLVVIKRIHDLLQKALEHQPAGQTTRRTDLRNALKLASTERITASDLPSWIRSLFTEQSAAKRLGTFLYIYPKVDTWHAKEMELFKKAYNRFVLPSGKEVLMASSGFVLIDVIRAVQHDTIKMVILATILVLLVLLVDVRSPGRALLVFLPLALGILWAGGIMAATYERLNLYNMVVLSTILGSGIDASVHLYHAFQEYGPGAMRQVIARTGLAVTTASVTTAAGFAGMILSHHGGLASIGKLALVGITSTLVAALTVLPATLSLWNWWRNRSDHIEKPMDAMTAR